MQGNLFPAEVTVRRSIHPTLVLPTIAQTLQVRESGGQPLREAFHAFLHTKRVLLVLDNCEQVLDVAPEVAALLASAKDGTIADLA